MITKKMNFVFFSIFILYLIFLMLCFPTYSQLKFLSWYGPKDDIWLYIREIIIHNDFLFKFHKALRHRIPDWSMPIAVIINGINMFFGFKQYKNKWWYYLLLVISIFITVVLIDCYGHLSRLE